MRRHGVWLHRTLVVDMPGGGASLNRRALLALLQAWPQSRRPLLTYRSRGSDSDDDATSQRFAQAPDAELYIEVRAHLPSGPCNSLYLYCLSNEG